jgi:hypothetical protein
VGATQLGLAIEESAVSVSRRRSLSLALAALATALLLIPAAAATAADPLSFTAPQKLPQFAGGEPSLAFDPNGTGDTYVAAPQGIPSALGGVFGFSPPKGIGFWASHDGGVTFPDVVNTGTGNGGGDSDLEVATDHTVFAADLEAAAAAICISKDRGKTFPNCDTATTSDQEGPENDRQWLTRGTKGELYLTYHDFTAGFPIIEKSTDGGQSFAPCGTIIDPAGPAAQTYTPQGGTLVSKPVVDAAGRIYVEFTTPPQATSPIGAALSNLYMAVSPPGGCDGSTVFENNVIYQDDGADLGKIFQAEAIDGAGHLYVVAAGKTKAGQPNTNLWLFSSRDAGKTWSTPDRPVNPPSLKSNVLPWVAGGRGGDELTVGWFGSRKPVALLRGHELQRRRVVRVLDRHARPDPLRGHLHAGHPVRPDPGRAGQPQPARLLHGRGEPRQRLRRDRVAGRPREQQPERREEDQRLQLARVRRPPERRRRADADRRAVHRHAAEAERGRGRRRYRRRRHARRPWQLGVRGPRGAALEREQAVAARDAPPGVAARPHDRSRVRDRHGPERIPREGRARDGVGGAAAAAARALPVPDREGTTHAGALVPAAGAACGAHPLHRRHHEQDGVAVRAQGAAAGGPIRGRRARHRLVRPPRVEAARVQHGPRAGALRRAARE